MLKWVAAAVAAILVLVIAAAVAIPYVVDTPRVQALISHTVTQALGRPVKFASVSVSVFPLPAVKLKDLQIAEDPRFGARPFLTIATGSFRLRVWPLLSGRVEFSELVLEKPQVTLIQEGGGRMNISSLGPASGGATGGHASPGRAGGAAGGVPIVSRIRIVDGLLLYTSRAAAAPASYRLGDLNLTLQGIGPASPVQFTGDAVLKPGDLKLKIVDGSIAVAGSRSLTDAPLAARVAIDGRNVGELAALALGPSAQVSGPLKGTLAVSGTLGAPSVTGELELSRLTVTQARPACPEPRRRTLTLDAVHLPVSFAKDVLTSQPFTTKLANGSVSANITLSVPEGAVQARGLAVRALPLAPVLVDYLCQGYAVTGPLDLTGEVSTRPAELLETLSGSGQLKIGPGKVVGPQALKLLSGVTRVGGAVASILSADLPASLFGSPLDFESITATYRIRGGVVSTSDLKYVSRAMQVTAAGQYGLADNQMNVDLVVRTGRAELAAKVTGDAASPSIRVNPSAILQGRGLERGARDVGEGVREFLKRLR
jgi:uncharacterized protein involved in outer membrane biogenesis